MTPLSPSRQAGVVCALLEASTDATPHGLSSREFEVLQALVAGRCPADIAEALHLSVKTVHHVHYQIKSKLGVGSDFELARLAWQRGWLG